jgi:hypothetical protein
MQLGDVTELAVPRPLAEATESGPHGRKHVHGRRVETKDIECEARLEITKPRLTDMQFGDGSDYIFNL